MVIWCPMTRNSTADGTNDLFTIVKMPIFILSPLHCLFLLVFLYRLHRFCVIFDSTEKMSQRTKAAYSYTSAKSTRVPVLNLHIVISRGALDCLHSQRPFKARIQPRGTFTQVVIQTQTTMGSQTNYFATLKNHLYTRRKDSVVSKLRGSIDGYISPPQSAHRKATRPVLVPNNTIPQISVNNSKAQIKTPLSPDSVTTTVKTYHPPYPDGTSTLVRRGKFRGVFDQRHLRCILIQDSPHDSAHCRYRSCYCMKALIVPSPLRQCMDASEMDELENDEGLWDEPNNWNTREIHLLARMKHRLTETRNAGQEHRHTRSFHNERFAVRLRKQNSVSQLRKKCGEVKEDHANKNNAGIHSNPMAVVKFASTLCG